MKRIILACSFALLFCGDSWAQSQTVVAPCVTSGTTCTRISSTTPMPVSGGGAGSTDEATFTYGTSPYGPIGGVYNSVITNLTSGEGGAVALTNTRSMYVDAQTSGNLYNAITAAAPALNATSFNTNTYTTGTTNPINADLHGNLYVNPQPWTPITGAATGTTGAVTGTLTATSTTTAYICTLDISAIGGTAAVGPITVAGLLGGSFTYELASSAAGVTLSRTYTPCIPASAVNTNITAATTADGTASAVAVNLSGYLK